MNEDIQLSLSTLQKFEDDIPGIDRFPSRILAKTYDEFIKILYEDIDGIIYRLQENPELRQNDKEDRLTIEIITNLCSMGYNASHDSKVGGHADLVVRKGKFLWIGEAKIHSDYDWLWKGFQQLNTRYSTGDSNQKDGGLLIYIRVKDARMVTQKWKEYLTTKNLSNYSTRPCNAKEICFFSVHKHERSGCDFTIRHMPVILYFNPQDQDKSERKSRGSDE
jgi:hypothetical protein